MNKDFTTHLQQRIDDYLHIKVGKHTFPAPYFINFPAMAFIQIFAEVGIPVEKIQEIKDIYKSGKYLYGLHGGKARPEELVAAAERILQESSLEPNGCKAEGIVELMKANGIGVDCSGMVYEVLRYSAEKIDEEEKFKQTLNWSDLNKMTASRAGTFIFMGEASDEVNPSEIRSADLIVSIDKNGSYDHVGIFIEKEKKLLLAHSTLQAIPVGMRIQEVHIENGKVVDFGIDPIFGKRWEELVEEGRLVFRRLRYLEGSDI